MKSPANVAHMSAARYNRHGKTCKYSAAGGDLWGLLPMTVKGWKKTMLRDEWKQLKSGTDIRGVAMEGVEGQPVQLTDEVVGRIAAAFAAWLSEKTGIACGNLTVSSAG